MKTLSKHTNLASVTRTLIVASALSIFSLPTLAGNHNTHYEVTITNITKNIGLTPFLAATHRKGVQFFEIGMPASDEVAQIAEGGNIAPLMAALETQPKVIDLASTGGLLMPGHSVMLQIEGGKSPVLAGNLSLIAMLVPTNDTFVALDGVQLPRRGSVTYFANAYDAGSELNDELCMNVPGPACGGEGYTPVEGEGYVYPSPGIHGEGDLSQAMYNWQGPVAKITVTRID